MKIGIDSYCYHRFFGEVYPQQKPPTKRLTVEDFLERAHGLGVDGVSIESCFLPDLSKAYLSHVRDMLDGYGLERVYAWGHPEGLQGGANLEAFQDMLASFERAKQIGAEVMRVVGSSHRLRKEPHGPQLERLCHLFREAVKTAESYDIKMAIENHFDFTCGEIAELLDCVGSPYLGVNFDTGNSVRLLDDPIKGMRKLAPRVYSTHIKDVKPQKGAPADEWNFFAAVPVGEGLVDNAELIRLLAQAGYDGLLAVEIDLLHGEYPGDEDAAVEQSVRELRRIVDVVNIPS